MKTDSDPSLCKTLHVASSPIARSIIDPCTCQSLGQYRTRCFISFNEGKACQFSFSTLYPACIERPIQKILIFCSRPLDAWSGKLVQERNSRQNDLAPKTWDNPHAILLPGGSTDGCRGHPSAPPVDNTNENKRIALADNWPRAYPPALAFSAAFRAQITQPIQARGKPNPRVIMPNTRDTKNITTAPDTVTYSMPSGPNSRARTTDRPTLFFGVATTTVWVMCCGVGLDGSMGHFILR